MSILSAVLRPDRAATDGPGAGISVPPAWLSFWSAFVLLAVIIAGVGGGVYVSARRVVMDAVHENLESIARIKVDQVQRWLDGARRDADVALNAPMFVAELERWLATGRPAGARRAVLLEHMQATVAAGRLRAVELRAADDGRVLLSTKPDPTDDATHRTSARRAAAEQRAMLEDFHVSDDGLPGVEMGFFSPIGGGLTARPLVTAHVEVDVGVNLLPFLNQWPGTSPTAETLLFRVDRGDIVYLNRSRHEDMAVPEMRRNAEEPTLLAAQVAHGRVGPVSGTDYRDVEVVGYALPVQGTEWHLIAKVDRSEALAELDRKARLAGFALACLAAMFAAWKAERNGRLHAAYRALFERDLLTRRLEFLARNANEGIVLADTEGRIIEANDRCAAIYGCTRQELLGMRLADVLGEHAAARESEAVLETELRRKDGTPGVVVEISSRMIDIDGARYSQTLVRDVTERRRAAEDLRDSEMRALCYAGELEDLYQNAPCGYHSIDADGIVCRMNNTELRWLGYTRDEVVGRMRLTDRMDESNRVRFAEAFARLRRNGYMDDLEIVYQRKDGTTLPVMISATAIYDELSNFVASRTTVVDISRLQALRYERDRQARRLEELSRHLVAVQEEERRRLSCELQDRAAPNLAALKLTIDTLCQALPAPHSAALENCLADAHALADDTVAGVREVCADLRPSLLDYAGLVCALTGYAQQYTRRTGIAVRLNLPPDDTRFGAEAESILFRIVQEALANVVRHARADSVDILLERGSAVTRLVVKDDGVGVASSSMQLAGPGIRSMRERAEFAGGRFRCVSRPGHGTEILVEIATPRDVGDSPRQRITVNDIGVAASDPQLICSPQHVPERS